MEYQRFTIGIVKQVQQLIIEIAIVDVDGCDAILESCVLRHEVLRAVVHEHANF